MSKREEIQKQIEELDWEINTKLGKCELPELNTGKWVFPKSNWVTAMIIGAWSLFGDSLSYSLHEKTSKYSMYAAAILAIVAGIRTIVWMIQRSPGPTKGYRKTTDDVKYLQDRRQELQQQLKELEER